MRFEQLPVTRNKPSSDLSCDNTSSMPIPPLLKEMGRGRKGRGRREKWRDGKG